MWHSVSGSARIIFIKMALHCGFSYVLPRVLIATVTSVTLIVHYNQLLR
jgi:hypothetical protein